MTASAGACGAVATVVAIGPLTDVDTETRAVSFRQQVAGAPEAVVAEAENSLDPAS